VYNAREAEREETDDGARQRRIEVWVARDLVGSY
jgi:hypothetical protein